MQDPVEFFFEISPARLALARAVAGRPFENSHDLLRYMNDYSLWLMRTLLNDTKELGVKLIPIVYRL
jgi:hypothetical protein